MLITSEHQRGHSLPKPFLYSGSPSLPLSFSRLSLFSLSHAISFAFFLCPFSLSLSLSPVVRRCCLFYFCRCSLLQRELLFLNLRLSIFFPEFPLLSIIVFVTRESSFLSSGFLSSCFDFPLDSLVEFPSNPFAPPRLSF